MSEAPLALPELTAAVSAVGARRKDGLRRLGPKSLALSAAARAGVPVPPTWALHAGHFDAFLAAAVPRRHDLRALVRAATSRQGDERCARAYARVAAEPLPDALVAGLRAFWLAREPGARLCVRPSLAFEGETLDAADPTLEAVHGVAGEAELVTAVHDLFARTVTAAAVAGLAAAGVREPSLALLVQPELDAALVAHVDRHPASARRTVDGELHGDFRITVARPRHPSGERPPAPSAVGYVVRARADRPAELASAEAGAELCAAAAELTEEVGSQRGEPLAWLALHAGALVRQLCRLAERSERELGRPVRATFHLAPPPAAPGGAGPELWLVSLHESAHLPLWREATTGYVELRAATPGAEPPTTLSASTSVHLGERALRAALGAFRSAPDAEPSLLLEAHGRPYLDVTRLAAALADVPTAGALGLYHALGGPRPTSAAPAPRLGVTALVRLPLVAAGGIAQQLRLESRVAELERVVERDFRGMQDLDLTLLPDDAMATTLAAAEAVLAKSAALWAECSAGELGHLFAIDALVRRRLPDAPADVAYALTAGAGNLLGAALALAVTRVAEEVRRDPVARERFAAAPLASLADLADGPGRGAVGQLVATFGDLCLGAGELAAPRWREDPRDLLAMVRLAVLAGTTAEDPVNRARALADGALARSEPALGPVARRLLWSLTASQRKLARLRVGVDRALYRALALVRRVVLDVDRRLRRLDGAVPRGGAFHCTMPQLAAALKSGRPELAELMRMRMLERSLRADFRPPLAFVGAPPRGPARFERTAPLEGIGASEGVVEGTALLLPDGRPPGRMAADPIVVLGSLDPALAPLFSLARGVVAEAGGALGSGAEVLRELAVPAVVGVRGALGRIRPGERLRLDGRRGTLERLAAPGARAG
ncbi:MAG: hypothetical protein IT373_19980 [Polyangiaceae bacterium]|nr:hypothetical protein [Polyangiaceae bacterium]